MTYFFTLTVVFYLFELLLLTNLAGRVVERHVKHVSLLPGAVGTQDVVWVLHGVHQDHHLMVKRKAKKWEKEKQENEIRKEAHSIIYCLFIL